MKKLILGKIGFLFSFLRYRKKQDPFKSFQDFKPKKNTKVRDKTFLVVPIRVSPTSNLFEGLIGYAMKLRGYNVYCLMDGGDLKYSDNSNINSRSFISNCLSVFEQNRFYRVFGFTPLFFDELINKKQLRDLRRKIKLLPMKDLVGFTYNGVNVGIHAKYGVMRYLKVETILSEHQELLREFLVTSIYTTIATEQAIKISKPDRALISHGCYSTWGSALETLRKSNVETSVWGRGYIGNGNLLVSHNKSYLFEYIHEDNSLWEKLILSNEQVEKVKNYYLKKRERGNSVDGLSYYKKINGDNDNELEFILKKNKEYESSIGIFPNIPWDGTMFSASESFPNMRAFIEAFIGLAKENNNIHYIIRSHPAEEERKGNESRETFKDILFSVIKDLPENITLIKPKSQVTSYQVSNIVDAALMFGSTLSLELSVAALPVIQVGLTNTSNKGIVYEPKNIEELKENIFLVTSENYSYPNAMHEKAIKYAYHWVYRKHIPETLVNLRELEFESYKINSIDDLYLNKNPTLDFICDRIEKRMPVVIDD